MPATDASARRARRISDRFRRAALLSLLVLVFAPLLMWMAEKGSNPNVGGLGSAYQWLARTLFENVSPFKMATFLGFVAYYIVRIAGYGLVAFATGALASRFVQSVIFRGAGMGTFKRSGHVVICGWNSQGTDIIHELLAKEMEETRPIAVLAQLATDPCPQDDRVTFVRGNPTNSDDLSRAGVERAECAIVMADATSTSTAPDDMDARTLLTVLAIESLNPNCYTCVEVVRSANRQHFDRAKADEMVVSAEMTGALLASSAKTHGLSRVVADLLTHPEGMEFYRVPVPRSLVGSTVADAMEGLKIRHDVLFVGIFPKDDKAVINPPSQRTLTLDDGLLVIATSPPTLT